MPGDLHLRGRFSTVVLRPEDLLVLRLEFINFMLETASPTPQLLRDEAGKPSYIAVHLQPQNIAEQAFFESAGSKYPSDPPEPGGEPIPYGPPVKARIAGPSRLVFRVPSNTEPIPYTLKSILEKCGQYVMSVVPHALPPKLANNSPAISNKLMVSTAMDKGNIKAARMAGALQVIQQSRINCSHDHARQDHARPAER